MKPASSNCAVQASEPIRGCNRVATASNSSSFVPAASSGGPCAPTPHASCCANSSVCSREVDSSSFNCLIALLFFSSLIWPQQRSEPAAAVQAKIKCYQHHHHHRQRLGQRLGLPALLTPAARAKIRATSSSTCASARSSLARPCFSVASSNFVP